MNAVRAAPRSGAAWGRLGGILRSYEFNDEARQCLAEAERRTPTDPRWPYLHSLLLNYRAPAEALNKLRRAIALCGNDPPAPRLRLARALAEAGQWDDARREVEALLRTRPDHAPALFTLALAAQAQGDCRQAVTLAQRCVTNAHTARAAWSLLSTLHQRLGETNAAFVASRRAAGAAPDVPPPDPFDDEFRELRGDARNLSDRAQQMLMAGRPRDAAPFIQRLVQEHPQFTDTWLLQGRQLVMQRQPIPAEQALRRYLELEPRSVNGHFQLGMALLLQERFLAAAEEFEKATQLKPDHGPAFFNIGFARVKGGRPLDAVQPFREAIRHNPEHIESYLLLADLCVQLGKKAEAIELASRAEVLAPQDRRLPVLREKIGRP